MVETYIAIQQRTHTLVTLVEKQHTSYHHRALAPVELDPRETAADLKVNCHGHFNRQGHFIRFDDFGCNVTIFSQ